MSASAEAVQLLGHRMLGEDGDVILTLNGGMMTYASWDGITGGFRDRHRILGCDFRGQLRSSGPAHPQLEVHVPDVIALLDALELSSVHVLATSFGAEVGLILAARHPERVRSLAAVTAVDRTPPGMAENSVHLRALARRVIRGEAPAHSIHDAMVEDIYSQTYREIHAEVIAERGRRTADLPKAWYEGLDGILAAVSDFDLTPYLEHICCPALVVHAADDIVMPYARVRALADGIAAARWHEHSTSGHALVVEDPDWVQRVYGQFLTELDG